MTSFVSSGDIPKEAEVLFDEYEDKVEEAERFILVIDPETNPYDSKYKARELLESIHKKLEAFAVILTVESTNVSLAREVRRKISSLEVRLGTIAYEVEEPHICEKELVSAGRFYFPGFIDQVSILCKDNDLKDDITDENGSTNSVLNESKEDKYDSETWKPPEILIQKDIDILDAMKCLNMFGILWSRRGQLKKSFMYLLAAKDLYHNYLNNIASLAHATNTKDSFSLPLKLSSSRRKALESLYTHNLFYLAQAYGHVHELKLSCIYCQETLRRQYLEGFSSITQAYEWAKNCMNISDFYSSMEYYKRGHLSLIAAKKVIQIYVLGDKIRATDEERQSIKDNSIELEADIQRRQAKLDENILHKCFERENLLHSLSSSNMKDNDLSSHDIEDILEEFYLSEKQESVFEDEILKTSKPIIHENTVTEDTIEENTMVLNKLTIENKFIPGLDLTPIPPLLSVSEIRTFEDARTVFLRGSTHIEAAKKYYVLDGYVTDHAMLLQSQSKLYHYLTVFEKDVKRVLAMETRRIELLSPVIQIISKSAFEVLHKQISYELGETYLALLDTKLEKFRHRMSTVMTQTSAAIVADMSIDLSRLKPSEIEKCNSYCRGALSMFAHFTRLYSSVYLDSKEIPSKDWPLKALLTATCEQPKEDLITTEEIRPYLNAHFLTCRILSKLIIIPSYGIDSILPIELCLKKYTWLANFANSIAEKKGITLSEIPFADETKICEEMTHLLPSKIFRMKTQGEKGLSL